MASWSKMKKIQVVRKYEEMHSTKVETGQTNHAVSKYQFDKQLEIFKGVCTI